VASGDGVPATVSGVQWAAVLWRVPADSDEEEGDEAWIYSKENEACSCAHRRVASSNASVQILAWGSGTPITDADTWLSREGGYVG
jgi:hypothetical protein